MKVVSIIPARMGSGRFPGKALANILGKTMIEHCYHRAAYSSDIDLTYVATCDIEISNCVNSFGGNVVMTSSSHDRATTRTSEALVAIEKINKVSFDIVVMVQGDEPLISPEAISDTLKHFNNKKVEIVNIMSPIVSEEQFNDKNNVKVVCDADNNAMYFSRLPIPHNWTSVNNVTNYMQTGIIAFRRNTLVHFNAMTESSLEKLESIDMNRVLEAGMKVKMVASNTATLGVDVPNDLQRAQEMMAKDVFFNTYKDNN